MASYNGRRVKVVKSGRPEAVGIVGRARLFTIGHVGMGNHTDRISDLPATESYLVEPDNRTDISKVSGIAFSQDELELLE